MIVIDYMDDLLTTQEKNLYVVTTGIAPNSILGFTLKRKLVATRQDGNLLCAYPEKCSNRKETCEKGHLCVDEEVMSLAAEEALENI